ncbi:MAG: hypothetical protein HOP17_10260 [Acidobacteria bacterium]|nr:hypothetical protein [Acidobacteriota bacterium]
MFTYFVGIILILAGVLVPADGIVGALRTDEVDPSLLNRLLQGAMLLKASLIALGLFVMAAKRLPFWMPRSETKTPLLSTIPKSELLILAAILLSATALRLYALGGGLWFDEIVTYVKYVQVPFGEAISTYDNQNQHILYSLLANLAFQIFGEGIWSLRLPAVLFGTGSIWALYLLGREVSNSREALLSAALLTFSYHHVWFSQNARGYTGLLFWAILSSWLFLRALREGRPGPWVLYAVSVALGAYTLIYMVFVVLGQCVIFLATLYGERKHEGWPRIWTGLFFGFLLSGILTFLLHSLVLPQFLEAFAHAEVGGPIWTQPLWGILEFVKGMQINFSGSFVAVFAVALFGAGLWNYARTRPEVVGLLVIPAVTCVVLKVLLGHHLWPRSLFFVMGFGALVVVRGIMIFGDLMAGILRRFDLAVTRPILNEGRSNWVGTALCAGLIILSAMSVPFAFGPKQDFLGAMTYVEDRRESGDAVVTVGLATFPYKNLYKTDWEDIETLHALNDVRSRAKRTWLIYTIPIQLQDSFPEIDASVSQEFKVVKQFDGTLNGGTIFVCQEGSPLPDIAAFQ